MSKSSTSENLNAVGLFPFLAVLLCTMGALLVLLVVMAQHTGKKSPAAEQELVPVAQAIEQLSTEELQEAENLEQQFQEMQQQLEELEQREKEVAKKLRDEVERLSHLEDHARRLQHELAELSVAAKQLAAMENNSTVDSERAEKQLVHLQELIEEKKKQVDELRSADGPRKAYAIVPYQGPNGTYRRPIYIECSKEGVTLHPEGVKLKETDFKLAGWSGSPLAAALRASRQYLRAKARRDAKGESPDPYPLILIRPDGISQYLSARKAIRASDFDFGYEFIQGDWKLEFPELADPQLAEVQEHALMVSREHLLRLARSAPSRFRGVGIGGTSGPSSMRGGGSGRYGLKGTGGLSEEGKTGLEGAMAQSSPDASSPGEIASGSKYAGNGSGSGNGDPYASEEPFSEGGSEGGVQGAYQGSNGEEGSGTQIAGANGIESVGDPSHGSGSGNDRYAQGSSGQAGGLQGSSSGVQSNGASQQAGFGAAPSLGQQSDSTQPGTPSLGLGMGQGKSIAESRGKNWAIQGRQMGNVPIRRTIQVVVRKNQMAILPSRHSSGDLLNDGVEIALNKSDQVIADDLTQALRGRVKEWGYAGRGLYWRPVLEVHFGPDSLHKISHFRRLLQDSGVELSLPETARRGVNHARR